MDFLIRALPFLLVSCALAQYEGYEGYEGHGGFAHAAPQQEEHQHEYELDYHAHPKYSFDYSVKDPHTGDDKEHWETRDGDKVKGTYTLVETDGTKRVVEYEADDKNGFNAVVHKIGTPKHAPAPQHQHQHKEPLFKPQQEYRVEESYPAAEGYAAAYARAPHGYDDDGFVPSFGHHRHQ